VWAALKPAPPERRVPVSLVLEQPPAPEPPEEPPAEEDEEPELDGQIVETPPPVEEKRPEDAEYLAEHDNTVEEETRSERFQVNPEVLAPSYSEEAKLQMEEAIDVNADEPSTGAQVGNDRFDPDENGRMAAIPSPFTLTNRDGLQKPTMASSSTSSLAGAPQNDLLDEKRGKETNLNTREMVGATYLNHIRRLVNYYWQQNLDNLPASVRLARPRYRTVVVVVLDGSGALESLEVTESSGSDPLDDAVVRAFRVAGPFPNPPEQLVARDGRVYLPTMSWTVELGQGRPAYQGVDQRANVQFPGILKAPR